MRTFVTLCSLVLLAVPPDGGRAAPQDSRGAGSPVHGLSMKRIDGKNQKLSDHEGKVLLVVNVASECGFTTQYEGLQKLHAKYADKGFAVLGFPSNDYGQQEPGTDDEIFAFCRDNFRVTFPMFSKVAVKGNDACPLYRYLQRESPAKDTVKWNFHKFLLDGSGNVIASFPSKTNPEDGKLVAAIEAALSKRGTESKPATRQGDSRRTVH
jgi:glutathione peroxidase